MKPWTQDDVKLGTKEEVNRLRRLGNEIDNLSFQDMDVLNLETTWNCHKKIGGRKQGPLVIRVKFMLSSHL